MSYSFSKFKVKVSKIKDYNKFCNECWNALSDAMYKLRTCEKSDKFYDRLNEADKFLSFTKEHLIHWKW